MRRDDTACSIGLTWAGVGMDEGLIFRFRLIDSMNRQALAVVAAVALVVGLVVVWGEGVGWISSLNGASPGTGSPAGAFRLVDATSHLGVTFADGAPQAFAFNVSAVLVTGVVGDPGSSTVPSGLLGTLGGWAGDPVPQNLSDQARPFFHAGDTLGAAWNGSSWIVTGEAAWGRFSTGAAAELTGSSWRNLTPVLGPYFAGTGGIWFDAWNGTGWLFGGASGKTASLVSMHGTATENLSRLVVAHSDPSWIQLLAWNGTSWIVGGQGVFGTLTGDRYVDLFDQTPFSSGGVFAAAWNGHEWLVGGGPPGTVEYLNGDRITPGPNLGTSFNRWLNSIVWDGGGWYLGGSASTPNAVSVPVLEYLSSNSTSPTDLSPELPASFAGGQIQFGSLAPFLGSGSVLFIGQGGLAFHTTEAGPSHGAAVEVTRW